MTFNGKKHIYIIKVSKKSLLKLKYSDYVKIYLIF